MKNDLQNRYIGQAYHEFKWKLLNLDRKCFAGTSFARNILILLKYLLSSNDSFVQQTAYPVGAVEYTAKASPSNETELILIGHSGSERCPRLEVFLVSVQLKVFLHYIQIQSVS